jgi:hypothetical protein
MLPVLTEAEPRLQRRYHLLIVSQLSSTHRLAAGVHAPPTLADSFATTQAAWRFYSNPRVKLPMLASPLIQHARQAVPSCCDDYLLVVNDWSNLHYNGHDSKTDRVELSRRDDLGYEMFTALAVSDRDGGPIAPLCVQLRAADGLHTTRSAKVQKPQSQLDGIEPVMDHITGLQLGKPAVFVIDAEADSVLHYRKWDNARKKFLIRANDSRVVVHDGKDMHLGEVADGLRRKLKPSRPVLYKGKKARQFVTETIVVLDRPARQNRVQGHGRNKRKKHKNIPGAAIPLRLVICEVRDANGRVLSRWLLLNNLPASVPTSTIALWYYWRWRIESYHKLLKSAGQEIEQWRQETAGALVRRLLVTAMIAVLVWHISRDNSEQGRQLRTTLVKLSGRQMRKDNKRGFTEPALLAGLCVAVPMMIFLETMSMEELKSAAHQVMPLIRAAAGLRSAGSG